MSNEITNNEGIDLQVFVDRLVGEKKFPEELEKEVLDEIKADLLSRVEDRINGVIISNLPEEKLEEFNKMLDSKASDEEVQGFCSKSIPNLAQLIATELVVFRNSYLS